MEALLWTTAIVVAIALGMSYPGWRLKRALAQPFPPAWLAILEHNIPIYSRMQPELQAQLQRLVQQFLFQKKFVGCEGLEVDDEMRVTIAGQACLLLLGRFTRVYRKLHTILVYPTAFMVPRNHADEAGIVHPARQELLGESWGDGRVVLSWDHVQRGAGDWTDGQNVVLHEFAHQLDSESGSNNGAPFLGHPGSYRNWSEVLSRDFNNLRHDAMFHRQSVLDHYGAVNPAEFFAVATETFFEKPWQMAERHQALYEQFQQYYRVDPREWLDPPQPEPLFHEPEAPASYGTVYGQWR